MQSTTQLIIRIAFGNVSTGFWDFLKKNSEKLIVAEHKADEDIANTHCHCAITNFKLSIKSLEAKRKEYDLGGQNSRFLQYVVNTKTPYDEDKLNQYVIKGDIENVKLYQGYDEDKIIEYADSWEEKVIVKKDKKEKYDEYDSIKSDFDQYLKGMKSPYCSLDSIRTWTMRWYWKRDGRMPPATAYKRNAASLYVYYCEYSNSPLDAAFEELKNLWY